MPHRFKSLSPSPYYYEHFIEMIVFVARTYGHVLNEKELQFIYDFQNLSVQSQCLYIRMYHRVRPLFHLNDLLYDEIGTCDAIDELIEYGYVRTVNDADYLSLLNSLTKDKLMTFSRTQPISELKASWKKNDIVNYLYDHITFTDFTGQLPDLHYYIPLRRDHINRFKKWWNPRFDQGFYHTSENIHPDQTYVVIDVETTGMQAPLGRITEIGAVKVKYGRIIDEWTSLINPECYIPPFITNITGISNEMVETAPFFHEIADEFENFLSDGIFVAHNVNFDYAFVSSEFKRLGKYLRKPKICTVLGMREHYPGHSSYSLANLCKEYGIPLTQHHRALCDAHAAAQLLLLVHQRKMQCAA